VPPIQTTLKAAAILLCILCSSAHAQLGNLNPPSPAFLIIAPDAFHDALVPYVHHKQFQLTTEVVSLEKVLKGDGADDPERVKRFLFDRWKNGCKYALLVGDADIFPVRYMVLDRVTPPAFDYAFYPSDLYYADLAKADGSFEDWNAQKDGFHAAYFGEVRGEKNKDGPINYDQIDYRPEIAVGRWPVSNVDELQNIIKKSMSHDHFAVLLTGRPDRGAIAALIATGGWVENRPFMDSLADKLAKPEASRWRVEKRYWADKAQKDNPPTPPPNEEQVINLLNSGASLILHCGHGSDDRWDGSLSVRGLKQVGNAGFAPVLMSAGCSTARFATLPPYESYTDAAGHEHKGTNDGEVFTEPPPPPACYQKGPHNMTGLGEQLLRAGESGAAAYIGCNTGSQPCGMTLMEGLVEALAQAEAKREQNHETALPTLGDCWSSAINYYYDHQHLATLKPNDDWYPPSIFFQGMKYMMFGDPTLQMP
jgi:hypothetical protein